MWPVVPICDAQKLDVRPEDLLNNGVYRKCDTYRGGGGYDRFNAIYEKRFGRKINPVQFVVQLRGCPLRCPYCYVTKDGIFGEALMLSDEELLVAYRDSGCEVFHLMGGAPALYLKHWKQIANRVKVFHSDFLLVEGTYRKEDLIGLPGLHAVSIKERYLYTNNMLELMHRNIEKLTECGVNFYITFTGSDELKEELKHTIGDSVFEDSFVIDIVNYDALKATGEFN